MPAAPPEPQPFLTNLRLIASPWHLFVFAVHPAFAILGFLANALTLRYETVIPAYPRMYLGLLYVIFSLGLALHTSENIKARLLEKGYVRSYTQRPQLEYGLNMAILGAMYRYLQSWRDADEPAQWELYALVTMWAFWFIGFINFLSIAPVLYFTARPTSAQEMDVVMAER
jgi:hypothetical protein